MALSEWLLIGGIGLLLRHGMKKDDSYTYKDSFDMDDEIDFDSDYSYETSAIDASQKAEWDRMLRVNEARLKTPCRFNDGFTYEEYSSIVKKEAKKIKRIQKIDVQGPRVMGTVLSQSGASTWDFEISFNNWGHITGTHWTFTENRDSNLPLWLGDNISSKIHALLSSRSIATIDFSDIVDRNKDAGTDAGMNYEYKQGFWSKLWGKPPKNVHVTLSSNEIIGEHVYPIIALLKETGFKSIHTGVVKDIDGTNRHYPYEIAHISIDGSEHFERNYCFTEGSDIRIVYHEKREIAMPFSNRDLKNNDYLSAMDALNNQGFRNVSLHAENDLITGWITKENTVKSVVTKDGSPIKRGRIYTFDEEIIVHYHVK